MPTAVLDTTAAPVRRTGGPGSRRAAAAALPRVFLVAATAIAAMVPGYTLRVFPLLSLRGAKINVEDVLVSAAVVSAAPFIVRAVRAGQREFIWLAAFVGYMAVPFAIGLRDPGGVFLAVRELRPLAFYLIALAYASVGYGTKDFRLLAAVYVCAACVAAAAVFLQLLGVIPLPGNRPAAPFVARYLEWSVPIVALVLALGGALADRTRPARLAWAAALPLLLWYLVAMQERTTQGLALAVALIMPFFKPFGARPARWAMLIAVVLAVIAAYATGIVSGPRWLSREVTQMVGHWSRAATDSSMQQRVSELRTGIPRFLSHPVFGIGLGGVIADVPPDNGPGRPWRYISSGYGFLLIKTGAVGFALFAWLAGMMLVTALRRMREAGPPYPWPRFQIAAAALIALLLLNVLHPVAVTEEGAVAMGLLYGWIMSRAH